jgi:hypothetical protein
MAHITRTNSEKRVARVRVLVDELRAKSGALADEKCRLRCVRIAEELLGLLQAEERHRRSRPEMHHARRTPDGHLTARQRSH